MPVVLWRDDPVIEPRVEHLLELPEDVFRRMHVHLQGGSGVAVWRKIECHTIFAPWPGKITTRWKHFLCCHWLLDVLSCFVTNSHKKYVGQPQTATPSNSCQKLSLSLPASTCRPWFNPGIVTCTLWKPAKKTIHGNSEDFTTPYQTAKNAMKIQTYHVKTSFRHLKPDWPDEYTLSIL